MNIDDITAKVKKISKETVAEVQKMNEVRSLSSQVNAQKKMIQAMYTEMGKKLYDKYKNAPLEDFEPDFQSLDTAFENIEDLQEQIRLVKGVTLCPNCRMEVGCEERFCSNCGCKMPEIYRIVEDEPEEALEDSVNKPEESVEEQPEESVEEQPEESVEEQPEESVEEQPEESAENQPEASAEEQPEASAEEQPEADAEQPSETRDQEQNTDSAAEEV